jgi:hypothetical protein
MIDFTKTEAGQDLWTKVWETFSKADRRKITFSQTPVRKTEDGKLEPIPYQDH